VDEWWQSKWKNDQWAKKGGAQGDCEEGNENRPEYWGLTERNAGDAGHDAVSQKP